jgi:hypothetical protein
LFAFEFSLSTLIPFFTRSTPQRRIEKEEGRKRFRSGKEEKEQKERAKAADYWKGEQERLDGRRVDRRYELVLSSAMLFLFSGKGKTGSSWITKVK